MNFTAVDLGASSTRYTSDCGKISIIPNNMVFLDPDKKVDIEPYDDSIESALEVKIVKDGESEFFPVKALVGQMAERYSSNNERPSVLANKHVQRINYVSGILTVALSKLAYNLDDQIKLYVALPPIEVKNAKEIVRENFMGDYTVTLPKYKGGTTVKFSIVDVACHEESFMSLLSYFFTVEGLPNADNKKYLTGNILSLDIGASTTDLAIVKNCGYLDKSGQTYKTGGNIARDYLIDAVRAEYGFDLPLNEADLTMAEGRIQLGNSYEDVSSIVDAAKKEFANSVVNAMQGYFRQVDIPIQTIRAIIVSGGGSMQSEYVNEQGETVKTSEPMSYYITQALTKICSGVEVEPYGESPRLANIKGLFIRAKVDAANQAKRANNQ